MIAGCTVLALGLPRSRILSREPYVVGLFTTAAGELALSCEPLPGVKAGKPFVGAVELLVPVEVEGHITGRIEVWESDHGQRAAGELITSARDRLAGDGGLARVADVATSALGIGAARVAIGRASALLGELLSGARDDRLAAFDVDLDTDELRVGSIYHLSAPRATLRLLITGDSGAVAVNSPPAYDTDEASAPATHALLFEGIRLGGVLLDRHEQERLRQIQLSPESAAAIISWATRGRDPDALDALVNRWGRDPAM